MKKSAFFALSFLLFFTGVVRAQDDVRSVQEELRRRSLYFGDVNGRDSAELQEATKRYQQRKGFTATGKADQETLKSLGLVRHAAGEPAPLELNWPDETVLPSDERIDQGAVAAELNEETGIAPAAVVSKGVSTSTKRHTPARSSTTATAALPVANSGQKSKNSPVITPAELAKFARDYFAAMGSNDTKRQLKYYADNVNYYRNGKIDRRIIEESLRRYQIHWPKRCYTMGREIRYSRINSKGEIVMTFPVSFTLKDGRRTVKGETDNRMSISAATVDPRITSISEQRIRR